MQFTKSVDNSSQQTISTRSNGPRPETDAETFWSEIDTRR